MRFSRAFEILEAVELCIEGSRERRLDGTPRRETDAGVWLAGGGSGIPNIDSF